MCWSGMSSTPHGPYASGARNRPSFVFFRGFDTQQVIASQGLRRNPLFLMDNAFQPPREARLSVKFLF